ncbi:MAG TPA: hypothetical protein VNT42_00270 [Sphingomonas sp.]|nr:hypothetical protein [Sphingomonas sp.]
MSAVLGVLAAVYGVSLLVTAGGGLLWTVSARFRRLLIDDQART